MRAALGHGVRAVADKHVSADVPHIAFWVEKSRQSSKLAWGQVLQLRKLQSPRAAETDVGGNLHAIVYAKTFAYICIQLSSMHVC